VIYEVNNTFSERVSYVAAAAHADDRTGAVDGCAAAVASDDIALSAFDCAKAMYVSPFTPAAGRYGFRLRRTGGELAIGVLLRDEAGALLRTHFRGNGSPATIAALARAVIGHPLMTVKVIVAIHFEALRLFLKGVPVVQRHVSPRYSVRPMERPAPPG
jgi:DUF1365 family protein